MYLAWNLFYFVVILFHCGFLYANLLKKIVKPYQKKIKNLNWV